MDIEELVLSHGEASAAIAPSRGALITRLTVAGRALLYLDRATLTDVTKNVRGGVPLLFPFAGRLDGNRLLPAGTELGQHGFARNRAWSVTEMRPDFLRLTLHDDEGTRAVYPHTFQLEHSFTVLPRGLLVELQMWNLGSTPMPVSPGWHPYFSCASAAKPLVRAEGDVVDAARFTPEAEFDFGVMAPVQGRARFHIPELGVLALGFSPEMRWLQCWGLPGRDFVCLEPFLGPNNTINTPARLSIPPGQAHTLWMRMELL